MPASENSRQMMIAVLVAAGAFAAAPAPPTRTYALHELSASGILLDPEARAAYGESYGFEIVSGPSGRPERPFSDRNTAMSTLIRPPRDIDAGQQQSRSHNRRDAWAMVALLREMQRLAG